MIQLYYQTMLDDAQKGLDLCRFKETKPIYQHWPIHCYRRYGEQMIRIMGYCHDG